MQHLDTLDLLELESKIQAHFPEDEIAVRLGYDAGKSDQLRLGAHFHEYEWRMTFDVSDDELGKEEIVILGRELIAAELQLLQSRMELP